MQLHIHEAPMYTCNDHDLCKAEPGFYVVISPILSLGYRSPYGSGFANSASLVRVVTIMHDVLRMNLTQCVFNRWEAVQLFVSTFSFIQMK